MASVSNLPNDLFFEPLRPIVTSGVQMGCAVLDDDTVQKIVDYVIRTDAVGPAEWQADLHVNVGVAPDFAKVWKFWLEKSRRFPEWQNWQVCLPPVFCPHTIIYPNGQSELYTHEILPRLMERQVFEKTNNKKLKRLETVLLGRWLIMERELAMKNYPYHDQVNYMKFLGEGGYEAGPTLNDIVTVVQMLYVHTKQLYLTDCYSSCAETQMEMGSRMQGIVGMMTPQGMTFRYVVWVDKSLGIACITTIT